MLRYAISDRAIFSGDEAARRHALLRWAAGPAIRSVDFLQLREKDLDGADLLRLARQMATAMAAAGSPAKLLINNPVHLADPARIALAAGAHGVHLRGGSGPEAASRIREAFALDRSAPPILSVSAHTVDEVEESALWRPDLILFGPVFEKRVHGRLVTAGCGLETLRAACAASAESPVLALGGVTKDNTTTCLEAGAAGVAAIRMFLPSGLALASPSGNPA